MFKKGDNVIYVNNSNYGYTFKKLILYNTYIVRNDHPDGFVSLEGINGRHYSTRFIKLNKQELIVYKLLYEK